VRETVNHLSAFTTIQWRNHPVGHRWALGRCHHLNFPKMFWEIQHLLLEPNYTNTSFCSITVYRNFSGFFLCGPRAGPPRRNQHWQNVGLVKSDTYRTTLVPPLDTWISTTVPESEYEARLISENSAWSTNNIYIQQHARVSQVGLQQLNQTQRRPRPASPRRAKHLNAYLLNKKLSDHRAQRQTVLWS